MKVATAMLLVLIASVAQAATVQGQLVYASGGHPAYIAVRLALNGRYTQPAYTGTDGKFYMKNIPAGVYQLQILQGTKVVLSVPAIVKEPNANIPPVVIH